VPAVLGGVSVVATLLKLNRGDNEKGQRRADVAYYISLYIYQIFKYLSCYPLYHYVSSKMRSQDQAIAYAR